MRLAAFDEMLPEVSGLRRPYSAYDRWLKEQDPARLTEKMQDAERVFRKTGITFAVYGEQEASERLIPFDIVPRIISGNEWRRLTQGIEQRVQALNAFLDDIYHRQEILRAGRVPRELIARNEAFNLPGCLQSVTGLVDEIIVADTGSTDRTKEVAASLGARVLDFPWCNSFAAARNASIAPASMRSSRPVSSANSRCGNFSTPTPTKYSSAGPPRSIASLPSRSA